MSSNNKYSDDDDWDADEVPAKDVITKEQSRWGAVAAVEDNTPSLLELRDKVLSSDKEKKMASGYQSSYGYGGKFGVEKDRMDKAAVDANYKAEVTLHSSVVDNKVGFGGKYGVQKDRQDKSAVDFSHQEKKEKHESQKDYKTGFGGKFGVQHDRKDASAETWNYKSDVAKHASQTDGKKGFGGKFGVQTERKDASAHDWDTVATKKPVAPPKPKIDAVVSVGNVRSMFEKPSSEKSGDDVAKYRAARAEQERKEREAQAARLKQNGANSNVVNSPPEWSSIGSKQPNRAEEARQLVAQSRVSAAAAQFNQAPPPVSNKPMAASRPVANKSSVVSSRFNNPENLTNDRGDSDKIKQEAEERRRLEDKRIKAQEEQRLAAERSREEQQQKLAAERAQQDEQRRLDAERAREKEERQLAADRAREDEERRRLAAESLREEEEKRVVAQRAREDEERRMAAERAKEEEERQLAAERARADEERRRAEERAREEDEKRRLEECRRQEEESLSHVDDASSDHNSSMPNDKGLCATAMYDYSGGGDDEISFDAGDMITNIDTSVDANWWVGTVVVNSELCTGLFPAAYVEIIEQTVYSNADAASSSFARHEGSFYDVASSYLPDSSDQTSPGSEAVDVSQFPRAVALYQFQSDDPQDLAFDVDEIIYVRTRENDDWWVGSIDEHRQGLFPSNHVQLLS